MSLLDFLHSRPARMQTSPWMLVAVGNPGLDNLETRRALGRNLLFRWMLQLPSAPAKVTKQKFGIIYHPYPDLDVLIPSLPNQELGMICKELLLQGVPLSRMVLIASDGRLNYGTGRLRLSGAFDHPGVAVVGQQLRTIHLTRLVFGIGPLNAPTEAFRAQPLPPEQRPELEHLGAILDRFIGRLRQIESLADLATEVNQPAFWANGFMHSGD